MDESKDAGASPSTASAADVPLGAIEPEVEQQAGGSGLGRTTAFFSIATGASRVAGLVREIVAASYFGVKGPMSAFTLAFQLPNLIRALFADAALQAAFVPVFTEQLEQGNRRDAFRLASTLIFLILAVLGLITGLFILLAPVLMPLFGPGLSPGTQDLSVVLAQLLFPILVMLGISGVVVGVLNSYNRFSMFAVAPLFWNVAIIAVLVGLAPAFPEGKRIYAYAIGVVVGTALQLALLVFDMRRTPFRPRLVFDWRSPLVKKVLLLMLPVTISLGLININLVINSSFGSLVTGSVVNAAGLSRPLSDFAPAAIDKAFRIYMLPQGMFSVAVTTVIFPTLSRYAARREYEHLRATMANGMRMILLVLTPAAAAILVLSVPMVRLVYEHDQFTPEQTPLVATALFWFAFSLPFNGLFLIMTRTFFSLQRPWVPTWISGLNLLITAGAAVAFYKPFGIGGIVAGTALATAFSVVAQMVVLRRELGGIELRGLIDAAVRIVVASGALAGVSYLTWDLLDGALGEGTLAQIASLGAGLLLGALVYLGAVLAMRVPEALQLMRLVRR